MTRTYPSADKELEPAPTTSLTMPGSNRLVKTLAMENFVAGAKLKKVASPSLEIGCKIRNAVKPLKIDVLCGRRTLTRGFAFTYRTVGPSVQM